MVDQDPAPALLKPHPDHPYFVIMLKHQRPGPTCASRGFARAPVPI